MSHCLCSNDRELLVCCSQHKQAKIVAVDLQPIGAIEGVHMIQGDITSEATVRQVISIFGGEKAELVVCDGAPDGLYSP